MRITLAHLVIALGIGVGGLLAWGYLNNWQPMPPHLFTGYFVLCVLLGVALGVRAADKTLR